MNHNELIEKAVQGDAEAIEMLMNQTYPLIYRYAYAFWRDPDRALDASQEIALKILRHLRTYRPTGSFRSWAFRIAYNHLRQQWRYEKLRRYLPLAFHGESASREHDPEAHLTVQEKYRWLQEGLGQLTARERSALILRAYYQMPYEEIAAAMGCSLQQVKNYLFRGRRKLQKMWRDRTDRTAQPEASHVESLS